MTINNNNTFEAINKFKYLGIILTSATGNACFYHPSYNLAH